MTNTTPYTNEPKLPYDRDVALENMSKLDYKAVTDSIDFTDVPAEEIEHLIQVLTYTANYYIAQAGCLQEILPERPDVPPPNMGNPLIIN